MAAAELDELELKILTLLASGATMDLIHQTMNYSRKTLYLRLQDVKKKLGTDTTTQSVAEAIRRGLIE